MGTLKVARCPRSVRGSALRPERSERSLVLRSARFLFDCALTGRSYPTSGGMVLPKSTLALAATEESLDRGACYCFHPAVYLLDTLLALRRVVILHNLLYAVQSWGGESAYGTRLIKLICLSILRGESIECAFKKG